MTKLPFEYAAELCEMAIHELKMQEWEGGTDHANEAARNFTIQVLEKVSKGENPRVLYSLRPAETAADRCVDAILKELYKETAPALSMRCAFARVAKALNRDEREVSRAWQKYWRCRGVEFVPPWIMRGQVPKRIRRK